MFNFIEKYYKYHKKSFDNTYDNLLSVVYVRNEINTYEKRVAVTPIDIKKLILNKYTVYIESSDHRIYNDNCYRIVGANITTLKWYNILFKDALIIGLKELEELDKLMNNKHLYFSHSFKNQHDSDIILNSFYNSNSIIYDFEYFTNNLNNRLLSFGFYAGFAGGALGILQYYYKKLYSSNINNLQYWDTKELLLNYVKDIIRKYNLSNNNDKTNLFSYSNGNKSSFRYINLGGFLEFNDIQYNNIINNNTNNLKIGIIGSNGKCGLGVKNILDKLNFSYFEIDKSNINNINFNDFDILYNCILLNDDYNNIWFDKDTYFSKNIIIIDISCDYTKSNNPIQLYDSCTTFNNPVYSYNKYVDIIAINNLPSLIPKDSSDYFSEKCINLLLEFNTDENNYWSKNKNIYLENAKRVLFENTSLD